MIYFPPRFDATKANELGAAASLQRWTDARGNPIGWRRSSPTGSIHGSILILHGNAGCAIWCGHYADEIQQVGAFDVFIVEYPGYADQPGRPSEKALEQSAALAFQLLATNRPIYLLGESLGTGVAAYLASRFPDEIAGVALLAPFNSLVDVAQAHAPILPVRLMLCDRFPSEERLRKYQGPIAVLTAEGDKVVPARFGHRLYDNYNGPKRLWAFPEGDHETLMEQPPQIWNDILEFLQTNSTTNSLTAIAMFGDRTSAMKRHVCLALVRLALAIILALALPLSHAQWGETYPGDGQNGFAIVIAFMLIGLAVGAVFFGTGSICQFLFRKTSACLTLLIDVGLFLVFGGILVYGGVTAKYHEQPSNGAHSAPESCV